MRRKNKKTQTTPSGPQPDAPLVVRTPRRMPTEELITPEAAPAPTRTRSFAIIGRSIHIKGELTGNEDLTIDGTVEGVINLQGHNLTIGSNGHIIAEVSAKSVVVQGHVVGDVKAESRIEIAEGGLVEGDLISPQAVLAEGARFKGNIDMLSGEPPEPKSAKERKPAAVSGKSEQTNAFDNLPDEVDNGVDAVDTAPEPNNGSGGKSGKKKTSETSKASESGDAKLQAILKEFDPAKP